MESRSGAAFHRDLSALIEILSSGQTCKKWQMARMKLAEILRLHINFKKNCSKNYNKTKESFHFNFAQHIILWKIFDFVKVFPHVSQHRGDISNKKMHSCCVKSPNEFNHFFLHKKFHSKPTHFWKL